MWLTLRGDVSQSISLCNFCSFLLIILGVFEYELETQDECERYKVDQGLREEEFGNNEKYNKVDTRCISGFEKNNIREVF